MTTTTFTVKGMHCEGCDTSIQKAVSGVSGVQEVKADYRAGKVVVGFADPGVEPQVRTAIEEAGFELVETAEG